jgi:hypothetical protein
VLDHGQQVESDRASSADRRERATGGHRVNAALAQPEESGDLGRVNEHGAFTVSAVHTFECPYP